MVGIIFGWIFIALAVLLMIYMITIVYTNGCGSRYRKFRIVSYYDEDGIGRKRETHQVQWSFFPNLVWHAYITDVHYMDTADFNTKTEAMKFIGKLMNPTVPKTEITNVEKCENGNE